MTRKRKTEARKRRKLKEMDKQEDIGELKVISELRKDQMKNLSGASSAPSGIAQHPLIGDVP